MAQSGLCIDSYTLIWEIQQKGSLNYLFQNSSRPLLRPLKRPILWYTAILFLHGKAFTERSFLFLMVRSDCASIATELSEEFNRRILLNIFYRIFSHLLPWKRPILCHTAILFLHGKAFTERGIWFLMARSGLCVDCCRIMLGNQRKGSLQHFRIPPPLFPWKQQILTHSHFASWFKKKKKLMRGDQTFHASTVCPFS